MGVDKIEVRGADRSVEILEKLTLLDTTMKTLSVKLDIMQTDITKIRDDVAAKP